MEKFRSDLDREHPKLHWHLTDDPKFKVDKERGPEDWTKKHGLRKGRGEHRGLMQTAPAGIATKSDHPADFQSSAVHQWRGWLDKKYAAAVDLSKTKHRTFQRGFAPETLVHDPEHARVKKVYPIEKAIKMDYRLTDKRRAHAKHLRDVVPRKGA
jgi:hypothetical protein